MKRNLEKTIARGRSIASKNHRIDIKYGEELELLERLAEDCQSMGINGAVSEAIIDAYYLGLATGANVSARSRRTKMPVKEKAAAVSN